MFSLIWRLKFFLLLYMSTYLIHGYHARDLKVMISYYILHLVRPYLKYVYGLGLINDD